MFLLSMAVKSGVTVYFLLNHFPLTFLPTRQFRQMLQMCIVFSSSINSGDFWALKSHEISDLWNNVRVRVMCFHIPVFVTLMWELTEAPVLYLQDLMYFTAATWLDNCILVTSEYLYILCIYTMHYPQVSFLDPLRPQPTQTQFPDLSWCDG